MVIVRVFGGLGNQMFQYAFGKYMEACGNEVSFDLSDFDVHRHHYGYELNQVFSLDVKQADSEKTCQLAGDKNAFWRRMFRKLFGFDTVKSTEIIEYGTVSKIIPARLLTDVYCTGYWQNIEYVKPVLEALRKEFSFATELNNKEEAMFNQYGRKDLVSVHIRRGDYIGNADLGQICTQEYYTEAIERMRELLSEPVFVVFSDDIRWCREKFGSEGFVYVDWNQGKDSYRDMYLMTKIKHHIIANSTFSWWGAMLCEDHGGVKIAPQRWNHNMNVNLLVDDDWIRIE